MACQCDDTTCTAHEGRECSNPYSPYRVRKEYAEEPREFDMCRPCASDAVLFGAFSIIRNAPGHYVTGRKRP